MSKHPKDETARTLPPVAEVFGFKVPTDTYCLHRGHAWAVLEEDGRVRVGLDDFSQKVLGRPDALRLPEVGKVYFQDHICLATLRHGYKAPFLAPVDGAVEAVNPKVQKNPGLVHDDPYGEGWLFLFRPHNLPRNLNNLLSGQMNVAWIDYEAQRLLNLMTSTVGVTLPDGGVIVDDVYGQYPDLGWRLLVQDFLLPVLTLGWRRTAKAIDQEELQREVMRVLNRTSQDRKFYRALIDMQTEALEDYKLSAEARTAILTGDLAWLKEHVGNLTEKHLMFVLSCLEPAATA